MPAGKNSYEITFLKSNLMKLTLTLQSGSNHEITICLFLKKTF